jgi:predicted amidohydrolase YtcJ
LTGLLLRGVEVDGRPADVSVAGARVAAVGPAGGLARPVADTAVIDGRGGALLPGLHDHHLHLLAMAAARESVHVGPPAVTDPDGLAAALRRADREFPPDTWVRAVGFDEWVAGHLDRHRLDAVAPGRPVRVQHRSGAAWVLNSAGLARLGIDDPTGVLVGLDDVVRDRLAARDPPDLAPVGRQLAAYGVTGVTDATPSRRLDDLRVLARAGLPQGVTVTGGPDLARAAFPPRLERGPVKLVVADHALPGLDALAGWMADAHRAGRAVAVHCVTRVALALALAAWGEAGARPGDRVEHGAVVPADLAARVAELGLTVVTQPGFVAERGDRYLAEVDADDVPHLYPCAGLLRRGIPVGGSTDAPFGPADPWVAVAAAVDRRTAAGFTLGPDERLEPERALGLFLTPPEDPGGSPRRIVAGARADLCLLDAPLREALVAPSSSHVTLTVIGGRIVFG